MKTRELILRRFDSLAFLRASHEIVKYKPEFYDENGVYPKDEWTNYSDIGEVYEGRIVTRDDYLDVENRFIDITRAILAAAGCSYITLGYVEARRRKGLREGMRVRVQEIDPFLRLALRGKAFIVFINRSKGVQFDFSNDVLYMHLNCRVPDNELRTIVESRSLYLDLRVKRVVTVSDDNEVTVHYFARK